MRKRKHVPTETAQTAAKGERKPEIQNEKALSRGMRGGPAAQGEKRKR